MIIFAAVLGVLLVAAGIYFKFFTSWRRLHQAVLGALTLTYGLWLALFTGTVLKVVVPGLGSMVLGSAAGAGVGFLTYLAIGTIGVVTGGMGIAIGAVGMALIGALVGGAGGAGGAALARVPLITPMVWAPVVLVGVYLVLGAILRGRPSAPPASVSPPEPE